MIIQRFKLAVIFVGLVIGVAAALAPKGAAKDGDEDRSLDQYLASILRQQGFTGKVGGSLERRLGRAIDPRLADLGRNLFHDTILGLHNDNSCSGCHSATAGFGDTQSIAIGIDNNFIVGPNRTGPRNQRRTPMVVNAAFFPTLMWNSRFNSVSGDPFDNRAGFMFPFPEGFSLSNQPHLPRPKPSSPRPSGRRPLASTSPETTSPSATKSRVALTGSRPTASSSARFSRK